LPFHIFSGDHYQLSTAAGRDEFERRHGNASSRRDNRGLNWEIPGRAMHGRDALCVAGCWLRPGFHWDVSTPGRLLDVRTPLEVWRIERYVNVYPDGYVRGARPHARRIWPNR
jgi:hypothetical protein